MSTTKPYYRRRRPSPTLREGDVLDDGSRVDFERIPAPGEDATDPVAEADAQFDNRCAAVVAAAVGLGDRDAQGNPKLRARAPIRWVDTRIGPTVIAVPQPPWFERHDLSEFKWLAPKPGRYLLRSKCLAVMAYLDYFPDSGWTTLRPFVSSVIMSASPGYCGTFGPGVDAATDLIAGGVQEGNYDMNLMLLIPIAYRYFDELTPAARERLITVLLARGRVHRPRRPLGFTSGRAPNDWSRAGFVSPLGAHRDIPETENHILMIATARYLANQLMYQRTHHADHDNRRNGSEDSPSGMALLLSLLRNILRGDFSEYNAKNYSTETRQALLCLCSYAYDHEVRLAARMVLDYHAARIAVSSNDLRRMVPFRRRNEGAKVAHFPDGAMTVNLLALDGADPMGVYYAVKAGNIRSCAVRLSGSVPVGIGGLRVSTTEHTRWGIIGDREDVVLEAVADYRLPPSVHDLFVNDRHRRFYQRLHRTVRDEVGGHRNADNMEINASSPSYLITAGGEPATWAIDPHFAGIVFNPRDQDQQLGVALTTSFMPTTRFGGSDRLLDNATDTIQFGTFFGSVPNRSFGFAVANYGVAPDFACGHHVRLPGWIGLAAGETGLQFVDRRHPRADRPGFYLAILRQGGMAVLEALDTWLHPEVDFERFCNHVRERNGGVQLRSGVTTTWTTWNANAVDFVIWRGERRRGALWGAEVVKVKYGTGDKVDIPGDAGNVTNRFLNGSIMNSGPAAVVQIRNPAMGTVLRLDMRDEAHPRRTAEDGSVESAGNREEVWADFDWAGPAEGDAYRPFATVGAATAGVASGGTVRMIPSVSHERATFGGGKRFRMVAPIGGVVIGA